MGSEARGPGAGYPVPRDAGRPIADWLAREAQVEDVRFEIKLVGEDLLYGPVRAALALHGAGIRRLFPPRVVQSLYFDTHEQDALRENQAGVSARTKLRWRWYGEGAHEVLGQMELKVRENQLGWKLRVPVATPLRVEGLDQAGFVAELSRRLPGAWADYLRGGLELSQWIRYRREYYASADRLVRVTIDRDLRLWDLRGWERVDRRHPTPRSPIVIVEAKTAPQHHGVLARLVERLPLAVDKCSKFVMAAAPGDAPQRSVHPS